ncbi:hypothetical protein NADE_000690 [Nannochloris sp. 'desiccata']|nr:hypothetical protein NADE_000690 [Chlorella desiccata (nom. nud.)]
MNARSTITSKSLKLVSTPLSSNSSSLLLVAWYALRPDRALAGTAYLDKALEQWKIVPKYLNCSTTSTVSPSTYSTAAFSSIKEEKAAVLYVDGETVEVVEQFKYLGTIFHCSNALSRYAVPARALSGRKAYHATRRRLEELELKGVDTNFRLFDVMVEPVLGYGAEVWAPELLCQDPLKK